MSCFDFFLRLPLLSACSRHQQYECKWYIPLADLTFQALDESDSHSIQVLPEYEIEEMKMKISVLKSEIQKEKVILTQCDSIYRQKALLNCVKQKKQGSQRGKYSSYTML